MPIPLAYIPPGQIRGKGLCVNILGKRITPGSRSEGQGNNAKKEGKSIHEHVYKASCCERQLAA